MFNTIKRTSLCQSIADQIRNSVLSGRLQPGDRLPSEDGLAKIFQVSRASVREALHALESKGWIVKKRGPAGDPRVSDQFQQRAVNFLSDVLRYNKSTFEELMEVRVALEPTVARLAGAVWQRGCLSLLEGT